MLPFMTFGRAMCVCVCLGVYAVAGCLILSGFLGFVVGGSLL